MLSHKSGNRLSTVIVNGKARDAKATYLRLPPELYKAIKIHAAKQGTSASALIIAGMEAYVKKLDAAEKRV